MQKYRLTKLFIHRLFLITCLIFTCLLALGQTDTLIVSGTDTIPLLTPADTLNVNQEPSENVIKFPIRYSAQDSLRISLETKRVFLYNQSAVNYEQIELNSFNVQMDIDNSELLAFGSLDSLGQPIGINIFTDRNESFNFDTLRYNFRSGRGRIIGVITEQEGGFLHGRTTKRQANEHIHIQGGKFTTCDHPEPHFYIAMSRAIAVPNEKVISGPAHLVIEGIPLPLALPFGFFPNRKGRTSGIIVPSYGEEITRGFFLQGLGYYFAISEYFDLNVTADIYSLGSWRLSAASNYNKRYRFSGSLSLSFATNIIGEPGLANFEKRQDYRIGWRHSQDRKANPNSTFSGSVDYMSSRFNRLTAVNPGIFAQNTSNSSISFNRIWPGSPFTLNANARATQNFSRKTTQLNLPSMSFNMARQFPFRREGSVGKPRWFENIEVSYTANLDNRVNTYDSLLFTRDAWIKGQHGFKHALPIRSNFKLFDVINITPALNYSGVLYTSRVEKRWDPNFVDPISNLVRPSVVTDTIFGLQYAHALNPSVSVSMAPNIFGMFTFRNSRIEAIRHVMSPSIGISFVPDMGRLFPDYFRDVQIDTLGRTKSYSIFENGIYGTPSFRGRSGAISLGLGNNLEMKIRTPQDTINPTRKIKLLDRLNFGAGYNIFADSLNWSNISMNGSNNFLDNKINLSFGATFNPYALDQNYRTYNTFEWTKNRRLARLTNAHFSVTASFRSAAAQTNGQAAAPPPGVGSTGMFDHLNEVADPTVFLYDTYVDFDVPWSLNLSYSFMYSKPGRESSIVQSLSFSGDLSLTPKWKISYQSGFDFENRDFTMTSISIHRDLHCWEASATVVPFGTLKSYRFIIRVRSSILQDLKYEKHRSWFDNFYH